MCEDDARIMELELRASDLEEDIDRLMRAMFALINDPANPHSAANDAYHALYGD